jgi:hypothetical protein
MIYAYVYYVNVTHKCPREKKRILYEIILVIMASVIPVIPTSPVLFRRTLTLADPQHV